MYYHSILETIGNTPLVRLNKVNGNSPATLLAKVEYFNPGQSIKDRIGTKMIEDAEARGLLKPGGTIIEGTSGNTGIGLLMVAIQRGYNCIFTTNDKQSQSKIDLLRAMGAKVIVCPTNVAADHPESYYSVARRLSKEIPNSYYPNQYDNLSNPEAHYLTTGPEIWEQTAGKITHFVAGMGTGGTISGVGKFLKEKNPDIKVIGIDTIGSVYKKYFETGEFDENEIAPYLTEGIGEDIIPAAINFDYIDDVVQVGDKEGAIVARRMAQEEGLFLGWSSGSAMAGTLAFVEENALDENHLVVIIMPDGGARYLSKIYNDEWMKEQGFLD